MAARNHLHAIACTTESTNGSCPLDSSAIIQDHCKVPSNSEGASDSLDLRGGRLAGLRPYRMHTAMTGEHT